jgi:RNA polymerase sigma factor (TIGR02999 family)
LFKPMPKTFISRRPAPSGDNFLQLKGAIASENNRRACGSSSVGPTDPGTVTRLLAAWRGGDSNAIDRLIPLVYEDLRAMARRQLRARADQTLQPTVLVHEAYLKLAKHSRLHVQDRQHFFAVAARAMRQLVVDHARRQTADKRGGGAHTLDIDDVAVPVAERSAELVALDRALDRLERFDEPLSRLVELRYFAGLSVNETAEVLGRSARTVKRDWRKARAILLADLTSAPD